MYAGVVYEFLPRQTIIKSSTIFSFDDGLTWFKLEVKLYSCRYLQYKHVFKIIRIYKSNMPMNSHENRFLRMQIYDKQIVFWE